MPKRIAVVDIGSELLTLVVAEKTQEGYHVLESSAAPIAPGLDSYRSHEISEGTILRLIDQIGRFKDLLKTYGAPEMKVVATSALREAHNRDLVCARIDYAHRLSVTILSPEEERYYALLALKSMPFWSAQESNLNKSVFLEIGAGSLQVSTFEKEKLLATERYGLGTLRLQSRFSEFQGRAKELSHWLDPYIDAELSEGIQTNPKQVAGRFKHLIAVGSFADYLPLILGKQDDRIKASHFDQLLKKLLKMSPFACANELGISEEAADLLLCVALIIERYLRVGDFESVHLPSAPISRGILSELLLKKSLLDELAQAQDCHLSLAQSAAKQYEVWPHAHMVDDILQQLFRSMQVSSQFKNSDLLLLRLAAYTHDLGKIHGNDGHASLSGQIAQRLYLTGLSPKAYAELLFLVKAHSGSSLPDAELLNGFSKNDRIRLLRLLSLFRIADGLDAKLDQSLALKRCRLEDQQLKLSVLVDPSEMDWYHYVVQRKARLFEQIFGLKLQLSLYHGVGQVKGASPKQK